VPSIGQTWVLASIGAVVEMGILSTLKRLLMESKLVNASGFSVLSYTFLLSLNFFPKLRLFHNCIYCTLLFAGSKKKYPSPIISSVQHGCDSLADTVYSCNENVLPIFLEYVQQCMPGDGRDRAGARMRP
jgi:hypothetical protein